MISRRWHLLAVGCTIVLIGGCVDRRFVVETNPPGAQITIDGRAIGPSPADGTFVYPGKYEIRAVAPGYEPLTKTVKFRRKWYDLPGLDFIAEVLYPGRIEDVRRIPLTLEPARDIDPEQIRFAADSLRQKGQSLPPQSVPPDEMGPGLPEPASPAGPGRTLPPFVPPPFPTRLESGVPATGLPVGGPETGTTGPVGSYLDR
jgi:hypothetical protein